MEQVSEQAAARTEQAVEGEIEANGVNLYYQRLGSGDPLVLVHGSWADATDWALVLEPLAQGFTVVAYDRRGHSRSERPDTQGSVDEDGDDLAALIEELGLAPAHVVTNSYGGNVALRLAARRPELFRSLCCHEPPVVSLLAGEPEGEAVLGQLGVGLEAVAAKIAAGDHEGAARQFIDEVALGPGAWESQVPPEAKAIVINNAPTFLDELNDPEQTRIDPADLARVGVPVHLTQGSGSPPMFGLVVDRLAGLLPQATRETLAGVGHLPQVEDPRRYAEVVTAAIPSGRVVEERTMESHDATAARAARERLQVELPVSERRLDLAGVSTNVLEGGDGPPVVLLHGPFASAVHWLRVIPGLVGSHRVIAPDLPGHGASEADGEGLDAERAIAWVAELVERTCSSPPAVIGHALGGAIGARFAAAHPDRLAHLVLVDSLGLAPFAPVPEFGAALERFMAQPSAGTHDELWSYCAYDVDRVRDRMGAQWDAFRTYNVERVGTPSVQAAAGALMEGFAMAPIPPAELARITAPTTLIWGREDLATPLTIAEDASDRFGWPLRVIEGCADDPPVERPEELVEALHAVLGEPEPERVATAGGAA